MKKELEDIISNVELGWVLMGRMGEVALLIAKRVRNFTISNWFLTGSKLVLDRF